MRIGWLLSAALVGILIGAGCGGRTIKVEGLVTLDGKPLPGATVTFVPTGGEGRQASSFTEKDGSFRLSTYKTGDGALPGEYKVTVAYFPPEAEEGAISGNASPEDVMAFMAKKEVAGKSKKKKSQPVVVPPRYGDPGQTPFTYRVPPDGKVVLELKSK